MRRIPYEYREGKEVSWKGEKIRKEGVLKCGLECGGRSVWNGVFG